MGKAARIGVAECESDVGNVHSCACKQLTRNIETCFIDQFAEALSLRLQSTVQRAGCMDSSLATASNEMSGNTMRARSIRTTLSVMLGCLTAQ
jgi:hypothetical protein